MEEDDVIHVPFDESEKGGWITRKKNIITELAIYPNIAYLHDYIILEPGWYRGFLQYEAEFDICMTRILNYDGTRYRDWLIWPHNQNFMDSLVLPRRECLLPYEMQHLTGFQYISGSYWIGKKNIMKLYPLDESLCHGEAEDVEWSKRMRLECSICMNTLSAAKLLKQKAVHFREMSPALCELLRRIDPLGRSYGRDNDSALSAFTSF